MHRRDVAVPVLFAVAGAALLDRLALLRRAGRAAHGDAFVGHDVAGIGVAVLVALDAAARIALAIERVNVALLLVRAMLLAPPAPPAEHAYDVPLRGYTKPPFGAFV